MSLIEAIKSGKIDEVKKCLSSTQDSLVVIGMIIAMEKGDFRMVEVLLTHPLRDPHWRMSRDQLIAELMVEN